MSTAFFFILANCSLPIMPLVWSVSGVCSETISQVDSSVSRSTYFTPSTFLTVRLPGGRKLYYLRPFLKENQFGKRAVHYYAVGQATRKWGVESTYGGKMTENIVQAIARDCLAVTLDRIDALGLQVVFHVHDEVICEVPIGVSSAEEISKIMSEPIEWATGLPLKADAYECEYYRKD